MMWFQNSKMKSTSLFMLNKYVVKFCIVEILISKNNFVVVLLIFHLFFIHAGNWLKIFLVG